MEIVCDDIHTAKYTNKSMLKEHDDTSIKPFEYGGKILAFPIFMVCYEVNPSDGGLLTYHILSRTKQCYIIGKTFSMHRDLDHLLVPGHR